MTNPFKKYRVDRLFFFSFAVLLVVVVAFIAWKSYDISSKALVQTTSHYQQQLLDELNSEITTRLVMIEQISLSTSRDNDLITFLKDRQDEFDRYRAYISIERALANLTYSIPLIQGIDLYMDRPFQGDAKSYIQFRDIAALSQQSWSRGLDRSDFAWSTEHQIPSFQGDIPVLSFARKIMSESDYLGVLVIHVKADVIRGLLDGASTGSNRLMTNSEGQQVLKTGQTLDKEELSQWIVTKGRQSGYLHIRDHPELGNSLLVYSKLDESNWTLVEITSWNQIIASSLQLAEVIVVIGIAAVLLVLLLTHFLSKQFAKPLRKLISAMGAYSVGGGQATLPSDYTNEFGSMFAGYRKQNERIEQLYLSLEHRYEQQRKAEIEALQANINPHFLYNMLDQLNWMAIEAGQDELSRILELMGKMFRIGLSNGASFIGVEEELEHIECYLEIQQLRWGRGLDCTIEAEESIRDCLLPKLTLQPFVENAIVHGFNARDEGHIHIRLTGREGRLQIVIDDNGNGLSKAAERRHHLRTGGYGIRNVRERLTAYFGENQSITLDEREEGGTRVCIAMPLLTEAPNREHAEGG